MMTEFGMRFVQSWEDADYHWWQWTMVRSVMRRVLLNDRHRGLLLHLRASRLWGRWRMVWMMRMMSGECNCTKNKGPMGTLGVLLFSFRMWVGVMAPGAIGYFDTDK